MNIHVNFLDGYYDSGNRCADMDRIVSDAEYRRGYRQRIADDREREMEEWIMDDSIEPAHSDHIFIGELMAMHEASSYDNEPGYRTSWMTY